MVHFNLLTASDKVPVQDHCGVVGAYCPEPTQFFSNGLKAISTLQTRGYDGAGCCVIEKDGTVTEHKGEGMVHEVFAQQKIKKINSVAGQTWIFQVRYGTSGAISAENVQPFVRTHVKDFQKCIVAHNGQFSVAVSDQVPDISDTAIFGDELSHSLGNNWDQRIVSTLKKKRGAWSVIIGTSDGMYLSRDPFGIRPLWYGKLGDTWVAASETIALEKIGILKYSEVKPGTIIKISDRGPKVIFSSHPTHFAHCAFETVYIQDGASQAHFPRTQKVYKNSTVYEIRERCGEILAKEQPITVGEADIAIGIPGTGIAGGIGYAKTLNIPYSQAIIDAVEPQKEQRTFMTAKVNSILEKVMTHFLFLENELRGKNVVLVDDSLVRGNVMLGLVRLLKEQYAVHQVHIRILCPPIDKTCHLGVNTRHTKELIMCQCEGDIEKICAYVGAESLAYLSPSGLREAITGNATAQVFCMGCMVGNTYPVSL